MTVKTLQNYLDWIPVKNNTIKDSVLSEKIHQKGYEILKCLDEKMITTLQSIYDEEHNFNLEDGGMFYSLYSKDKDYRERIHTKIQEILTPILNDHFINYKNVINSFVVKLPGEKSEFYVHQDTTGLDEFRFSPLSLWIPLQDITPENGALAVIEKTHWFFSPFRGVSFPFPFSKINDTIKKYLSPIYMKAGEVLFFDNRIIHNSLANSTKKARVAIICGIFPEDADFINCYQNQAESNQPIEVFKQDSNFLLENPHFFYNCTDRPETGKLIKTISESFPEMSGETFIELCELNDIREHNIVANADPTTINCQLIAEPDGVNRFDEVQKEVTNRKPENLRRRLFPWLKKTT